MAATAKPTLAAYLARLSDEQRAALEKLRKTIKAIVPKAEEGFSYGLPAFHLHGKPLVAYGATAKHCSYFPMSGAIVSQLEAELDGYDTSKGTIRFQPDEPLPATLVRKLLRARLKEIQPHALAKKRLT